MRPTTLLLIATLTGCSKAPTSPTPAKPAAATPAKKPAAEAPWAVAPDLAGRLTQAVSFGNYQLQIPTDYKPLPTGATSETSKVWRGPDDAEHFTVLIANNLRGKSKIADPNAMRQFLVDFSAGVTDPLSVRIQKRGPTETGELAGLKFSRFTWTGRADTGLPATGTAYAAIDGEDLVTFVLIAAGQPNGDPVPLMESAVATLKKK